MNGTELTIMKKASENLEKLNGNEQSFIESLADRSTGAPLSSPNRARLYAIGKKFGLDGRKMFAREVLERRQAKQQHYT